MLQFGAWPRAGPLGRRRADPAATAGDAAGRVAVDRCPPRCFTACFDLMELLHEDLRPPRRPQRARSSPETASAANRRMVAAALFGRIRASFESPAVRLSIATPERRLDTPGRCGESNGSLLGGENH